MNAEKMNMPEVPSSYPKVHLLAQHLPMLLSSDGEQYDPAMKKRLQQEAVRDHQDNTVTGLVQFWSAVKHHVRKGVIPDADFSYVDGIVDYPGFGQAMQKMGWIKYDKKKNCLLIPEVNREQLKAEVKKAQAALRQKRHRMKLKVRKWIIEGRKAAAELANYSRSKNENAVTQNDLAYDEQGRMTRFDSTIIDGKEMHVGFSSPRHRERDRHGTQAGASNKTVGDYGVTPGIAKSVTQGGTGVTPGVTDSVTHGDSGVTQSATKSVTHGASGVTPGVAKSVTEPLSRVIPSRAHTRFSFLRSRTLRSKHKTTHSAREKIFMAAMRFKTRAAQNQHPTWPEHSSHPCRNPVSLPEPRNSTETFDALLNVTQSVTLWRNGQSGACVTRKIRNAELHPLANQSVIEPVKFRLFSDWSPSADFLAHALHIGLTLSHEATDFEVAEFINYWSEEGAQHTQKQWETKLARFIGKGRKRAAKRASGHQDFTIPTSMDYAIPDGFHGG